MRNFLLIITTYVMSFFLPVTSAGQEDRVVTTKETEFIIYYRFDDINFDPEYLNNKLTAAHIRHYLNNSPRIDSITIHAWASPEGGYDHNVYLSRERAKTAKKFLLSQSPDSLKLDAGKIRINPSAENWPGLTRMVEERYHRHDRAKVLRILNTEGIGPETRKWRLQQLDKGYTWSFLVRNYMPKLRTATWVCVWGELAEPLPVLAQMRDTLSYSYDYKIAPIPEFVPDEPANVLFALKTNLLYDAVTAVNFEVEVPIGDRWSIAVEDLCPWWTWGPNKKKYAFEIWAITVEPRYWFKKGDSGKKLTGHYLGAYAMSSKYDFQRNKDLCYQGEFWSTGLSYGYAFPLGRFFNLELSASVGYLQTKYRHYQPDPGYNHLYIDRFLTGTLSYFGPTKAEISLVMPINARINNKRR